MASEVVNDLSLVEARETQIEDAHVEETYAEKIQVHETLSDAHAEEFDAEELMLRRSKCKSPVMLRVRLMPLTLKRPGCRFPVQQRQFH